ncbi:MAG: DNA-directed RNA polymerase subunit alpha C-terminal domain-containing protein [Candidatus Promineifilaceae bacterium]
MTAADERVEAASPLSGSIDTIGLNARALKAMHEAGVETLGDVVARLAADGDDGLLSIRGVGQAALIETKKHLRSLELIE